MAQPLRSLPPEIKNAPLVVPTRTVKRAEDIRLALPIRNYEAQYTIAAARDNARQRGGIEFVMRGLDPRIHEAMQQLRRYGYLPPHFIMDCRVIGERSDAVLRPAMPGNDAERL